MTDAIQKAREALETARETLEKVSRLFTEEHQLVLGGKRWGEETLNNIDAALAALDAETKVKVLDWQVICSKSGNCEAETPFGEYVIQSEPDGWCLYLMNQDDADGCHSTLDYAKSAAQADYERRIRSALVTPGARS